MYIMPDYSKWQPTAVLNDQIRKKEKIKNNLDYRSYLQKYATSIMEFDKNVAYSQTGGSYSGTLFRK